MLFNKNTILALSVSTAIALAQPVQAEIDFNDIPEKITFNNQLVDAAEYGDFGMVQALLLSGYDANEKGDFETTALIRASYHGSKEIVKLLISKGANPNTADIGGATALQIAAREGHDDIVKILIQNGAEINAKDEEGNTALMKAAQNGNAETQKIIIAMGADVNRTNAQGDNAIIFAAEAKQPEAVAALVANGADIKSVDQEGSSVADIAIRSGEAKTVASIAEQDGYQVADLGQFIENNELNKQAPANSGEVVIAQTDAPSWYDNIAMVFEAEGTVELAAAKDFKSGSKYTVIDLGSFKNREFAEKRAIDLKTKYPELFSNVGIGVVQNGASFNVNAGVLDNAAEANAICKKLSAEGTACRAVETNSLSQNDFNVISGKTSSTPKTDAKLAVEDQITPAPVAKVEAKQEGTTSLSSLLSQKKPIAVEPPSAQTAAEKGAEQNSEPKKPAEITKAQSKNVANVAPTQSKEDVAATLTKILNKEEAKAAPLAIATSQSSAAEAKIASVSQKDEQEMQKLIEKINKGAPSEPASSTSAKNIGGFNFGGNEETQEEALQLPPSKPAITAAIKSEPKPEPKFEKSVVAKAVAPVATPLPTKPRLAAAATPEVPVITTKKNIVAPILPSQELAAKEKAAKEAAAKEQAAKEIAQKEAVAKEMAERELAKKEQAKKEAAKLAEARISAPEPKTVDIQKAVKLAEQPKPLAPTPAPLAVPALEVPAKPVTTAEAQEKIKELPPLQSTESLNKAAPKVVFSNEPIAAEEEIASPLPKPATMKEPVLLAPPPAQLAAPSEDKFRVAAPIKVTEQSSASQVEFKSAPTTPLPITSTTSSEQPRQVEFARSYRTGENTHYVRVEGFENTDDVQDFWGQFGRQAPQATVSPMKSLYGGGYAAVIGPFSSRENLNEFCGTVREEGYLCGGNRILSSRNNYRSFAGQGLGTSGARHSDLSRSGGTTLVASNSFNSLEPASGNWVIQLGSYSTMDDAMTKWSSLQSQNVVLRNREPILTSAESRRSSSSKHRLRVGNFASKEQAEGVCTDLRRNFVSCILLKDI